MNDVEILLKKTLIITVTLCAVALALRMGGRMVSGFADFYIGHTNAFWVNSLGRLSSIFPFSLVEVLIYALILGAAGWLIGLIIIACGGKKAGFLKILKKGLAFALPLAALIFFLFESNEDIGFYRTSFAAQYGYGSGSYSTAELAEVCEMIAGEINNCADSVSRGGDGIMVCDSGVGKRVKDNMIQLGKEYDWLSGMYSTPKPVCFSKLMSYTNMAGIFSAYTMEANYNADMTQYNLPFSISHELAHVKGILRENEANFIAYLNCRNSKDADIYYAGMLSGWVYCGNELYKRDKKLWEEIYNTLDERAGNDLRANNEFWASYKGKVSEAAESFNDSYLKGRGQTEGKLSYDRVVDLIVSYESDNIARKR